jgi:hypothetical protein
MSDNPLLCSTSAALTDSTSDLDQLNLSLRTYNALRRAGIHTIGDILRLGRAHFATPGRRIGPVARMEIAHGLEQSGFHWTAEGRLPMPELPSVAALMVGALELGDSPAIRQGLARVLRAALRLDSLAVQHVATDLEQGATGGSESAA